MNLSQNVIWLLKFAFTAAFLASFYTAFQTLKSEHTGSAISFSETTKFPSFTFCPLKYSYQTLDWIEEHMQSNRSFQDELNDVPSMLDALVKVGFMKNIAYDSEKVG